MSDLKYNRKYQPLFRTKKNIRYKHVTGGRGSGKSHALSVYLLMKTYNKGEVILYTRYTMVSASLSIIPEFYEKIEQFNGEIDASLGTNECPTDVGTARNDHEI